MAYKPHFVTKYFSIKGMLQYLKYWNRVIILNTPAEKLHYQNLILLIYTCFPINIYQLPDKVHRIGVQIYGNKY